MTGIAYAKSDGAPIEAVAYTYDAGGQRIVKTLGGSSVQETPFSATYDEANRLTGITLGGEVFTLTYDSNGNLESKGGPTSGMTSYLWNARNQLASISGPSGSASFRYDALGRRIERMVNGDTTGFLYDGAQAIAELKGSALDTVYHTGLEIDEVLARYGASGNKSLLTDALMSVIAQANDDQSIGNFYAYSPYGQAVTLGPDEGNPLQYTGRENDGTGLYYYRARYYDPGLKRFVSEDPIGMTAGPNFYAYVSGDPISLVDPGGLLGNYPGYGTYVPGQGPVSFSQATGLTVPSLSGTISANIQTGAIRGFPVGISMTCTFNNGGISSVYLGFGVVAGTSATFSRPGVSAGSPSTYGDPSGFGIRTNLTFPTPAGIAATQSTFVGANGSSNTPIGAALGLGTPSGSATFGYNYRRR